MGVGSTPELDRGFVDQSRLVLYAVVLWRSRVILFFFVYKASLCYTLWSMILTPFMSCWKVGPWRRAKGRCIQMTFALGKGGQDKRNGDCMDLVLTRGLVPNSEILADVILCMPLILRLGGCFMHAKCKSEQTLTVTDTVGALSPIWSGPVG